MLCVRDRFGMVRAEVLGRLPGPKLIVTRSADCLHIDLVETKRRSIPMRNMPEYGAHMTAQQALVSAGCRA
jgi:lactate dehydrogenase-like 2-hydroxyacid dehydrogenase